jgi:hypothetical protein
MSKKLLHLVQRHAGIEQNSGDAGAQAVRSDIFLYARLLGSILNQLLNISRGVSV